MNLKKAALTDGSTGPADAGIRINNIPNAAHPLIRTNKVEKTMIEIRAHFASRNRPTLVMIPQTAGSP